MFTHLRTRVLAGGILTILLVFGLVAFVLIERLSTNQLLDQIAALTRYAGRSRELSLYAQYGGYNISSYTRGNFEQRVEFDQHAGEFRKIIAELHQAIAEQTIAGQATDVLTRIVQARKEYDRAAQELFNAADVSRISPLSKNEEQATAAWKLFDQQSALLDQQSQDVSALFNNQVARLQDEVNSANDRVVVLTLMLAITVFILILLIQQVTTNAIGAPLEALVSSIIDFSAGNRSVRVTVKRNDEIGSLATAFNEMAATIEDQQQSLVRLEVVEAARSEAEAAHQRITTQLALIESQRTVIREMSVPILPISNRTMVMPLVGDLDGDRMHDVQQRALQAIESHRSSMLIVDITGVPVVDSYVALGLLNIAQGVQLLGAEVVLVGIRPEVAQTLVGLGIDLDSIITRPTLQSGIDYALRSGS